MLVDARIRHNYRTIRDMGIYFEITPDAIFWMKIAAALIAGAIVTGLIARLLARRAEARKRTDEWHRAVEQQRKL